MPIASAIASLNGINIIGTKDEYGNKKFLGSGVVDWFKNLKKNNAASVSKDRGILQSYFSGGKDLVGADFEEAFKGASVQARNYAKSVQVAGTEQSVLNGKVNEFAAAQTKNLSIAGRIGTAFKNIGISLASMAVQMAAIAAIAGLIQVVYKAIDKAHMSAAEASEVTSNVIANYDQSSKQIEDNLSSVEALRDRFEDLSRGVSENGENISLTTEQYQEYQDIVNQLVAINPALVQGYNDENQAIIDKNNSIEKTIELLKKQRVEEAKDAVYGGTAENDGNKSNAQAAYLAAQEEYKNAKANQDDAGKQIDDFLSKVYSQSFYSDNGSDKRVKDVLEKYIGTSYKDYVKQAGDDAKGIYGYIQKNADVVHANITSIISELNDADLLNNSLAAEAKAVVQNWDIAGKQIESSTGNLSSMLKMAFKADEAYYDNLTEKQQTFLDAFSGSIDSSILEGKDENAAINYAEAMMKVAQYNDDAKKSMEEYTDLMENRGSMTISEYQQRAQQAMMSLKGSLRSSLTDEELNAIDFRKLFGLDSLQNQTDDLKSTIQSSLNGVTFADTDTIQEAVDLYQIMMDDRKEMAKWGLTQGEAEKGIYGNLDFNNRSSVKWTRDLLEKNKNQFLSWASNEEKESWKDDVDAMDSYWQNFVNDMEGSVSTVLGTWGEFGEKGIPIAFSPLRDNGNTLVPLSQDYYTDYLNSIVDEASKMDGDLVQNILNLDKLHQNIIADVGDSAERTASVMHFAGADGEIKQISADIQEFCEINGYSTEKFFQAIENGSEEALQSLAAMVSSVQDFNLDNLTLDQLSAFNQILAYGGDDVAEYVARLKSIDEAGHLGEFLDEFNKKLDTQSSKVRTVAQDLTEYQTALTNATDTTSNHESMVSIYDEFAKSVNKGQINTDAARAQMELLIGKVVDLKEAKEWVKENQGFFLTGTDDDKIGQDLTGGFNTLHNKYNALSKDQKALVDSMMKVDWENGSISVAKNDVVDLARAFGMSTASLQQFFDLVQSYSDPAKTDISTVADTVKQLNSATATAAANIKPELRATAAAWDTLSVAQKQALESVTAGTTIDPTQMTYNELADLTNSYNAITVAFNKDFSSDNINKFFEGLGDGVATVKQLSDGTQAIDITNVTALVDKLKEFSGINIDEGNLRTILTLFDSKTLANGDKYQFTIGGEKIAATQEDQVKKAMDDLTSVFEQKYGIKIDTEEAKAKIDEIVEKLKEIKDTAVHITVDDGKEDNSPKTSSGGFDSKSYDNTIPDYLRAKPVSLDVKVNTSELDDARDKLDEVEQAGGRSLKTTLNVQTNADAATQKLLDGAVEQGVFMLNITAPDDPITPFAEQAGETLDNNLNKERTITVDTSTANSGLALTLSLLSQIKNKSVTVSVNQKVTTSAINSYGEYGNALHGRYMGQTGKMQQFAGGGRSLGGKTLVGELGPEQWISRDGKHSKIVGKNGMEVIDTRPGDAIVPADITASLMRGGMRQGYDGIEATGALANLRYGSGGKYTNWTGPTSKANSKISKVEVTADTSQLDDAAKEALDKIKEEVDDIIDQLEHKIYLLEEQHGDPYQIVAYYEQIMDEANKAANKYRAQGQKDSSEYVRSMQTEWWKAHDAIIDTMKDMYDKITSEHENAIKLIENQLDRALDTDKINKAYQRATRFTVDTKQFTDLRSIIKETSAVAAASMASLGAGLGSLVVAMSSAQRVINSMQPMTVDVVSSVIDGDAIENYLNQTIEHYRAMQENVHKEADYYRSQGYSDLSDEVSELSDKWWEYEDAVKDVKQKVIDYLSDIVDKASESVDEIQDVLSTFKDAAKEYSTNGGFISVDTFQEIVKLGPEYLGYLQDENGLLSINEDAINRVIRAKTEQMALESASAYVERLRLALQQDSIEDLNHLLTATADLTEVQWGSVYAQLAMLGLTEDGYAAAVHNIDALRSLAYNAMSGVGIDFDDAKDGIDEIYEYVKEMIKDNVDRQVDALEELKDKYSEIIDLKKESLKASKDEADYQDEVADKVKEMAKLQEKINALSLDDSRSSIAKRKELEEQLADAQKELSKTQADEVYDKQTDNLDKMQEAYEKEKDAEIKKLQEFIQSTQKLDDAARKYIRENWSTLYDTLYKWNYEYGSHLSTELESSWDKALKAAKQYGDYLTALDAIGSSGSNVNKAGSSNIVGPSNSYSDSEMSKANGIVAQMQANSEKWKQTNSQKEKDALHEANDTLRRELESKYQLEVTYDSKTGTWGVDGAKGNLYNKYYGVYHSGGVVGDAGSLRQDEMLAVLQKGELVLDKGKQKSLDNLMKIASAITSGISSKFISPAVHAFSNFKAGYNQDAVPVNNNQSVNITFGDTVINGEKGDTLKQHEAINRRMVNEIIDVLKIKK